MEGMKTLARRNTKVVRIDPEFADFIGEFSVKNNLRYSDASAEIFKELKSSIDKNKKILRELKF